MMGSNQSTTEGSTLVLVVLLTQPTLISQGEEDHGATIVGNYGHAKDTCWKIHRKLASRKPFRPQPESESRDHTATTEHNAASSTNCSFSKEQIKALQKLSSQ